MDEAVNIINEWIHQDDEAPPDVADDLTDLSGDPGGDARRDIEVESEEVESEEETEDVPTNPAEDPNVPQRFRKYLTRRRNVDSIDAALDIENFKPISYLNCDDQWETLTGYLGPKSDKRTEKIFWTNDKPSRTGRQRACDVIAGPASALKPNVAVQCETDAWDLFIDNSRGRYDKHQDTRICR